MQVSFSNIAREFDETFGYVKQDIIAIRTSGRQLNYTVALLICCACEMLAWHRGMKAFEVFADLLPSSDPFQSIAKTTFEALRNGLAHKFRPNTIEIGKQQWRFTLAWETGPHASVTKGHPNWLRLNIKILSERLTSQIDAYEQQLRSCDEARANFLTKSENCKTRIPDNGEKPASAWAQILQSA